jgi:hypothetical protein
MDTRALVTAEIERLIRVHDTDPDGHCDGCKATGDVVDYPCDARLICERAAIVLARRRTRAGGTAYERRRAA